MTLQSGAAYSDRGGEIWVSLKLDQAAPGEAEALSQAAHGDVSTPRRAASACDLQRRHRRPAGRGPPAWTGSASTSTRTLWRFIARTRRAGQDLDEDRLSRRRVPREGGRRPTNGCSSAKASSSPARGRTDRRQQAAQPRVGARIQGGWPGAPPHLRHAPHPCTRSFDAGMGILTFARRMGRACGSSMRPTGTWCATPTTRTATSSTPTTPVGHLAGTRT
jgi:hypothetical protein